MSPRPAMAGGWALALAALVACGGGGEVIDSVPLTLAELFDQSEAVAVVSILDRGAARQANGYDFTNFTVAVERVIVDRRGAFGKRGDRLRVAVVGRPVPAEIPESTRPLTLNHPFRPAAVIVTGGKRLVFLRRGGFTDADWTVVASEGMWNVDAGQAWSSSRSHHDSLAVGVAAKEVEARALGRGLYAVTFDELRRLIEREHVSPSEDFATWGPSERRTE